MRMELTNVYEQVIIVPQNKPCVAFVLLAPVGANTRCVKCMVALFTLHSTRPAEVIEETNTVQFSEPGLQVTEPQEHENTVAYGPFLDNSLVDMDNLSKFASMPVQVATEAWTNALTSGAKFGPYTLATYLAAATGFSARLANVGAYKFKNLVIRVQTASPANYNGILGLAAWPHVTDRNLPFSDRASKLCQSMLDYIVIPQENAMEIRLPWVYPYGSIDRKGLLDPSANPVRDMWQITPFVVSPLEYGTGGATLNFETFMWLEGFECLVTVPESGSMKMAVAKSGGVSKQEIDLSKVNLPRPPISEDVSSVVRGVTGVGSKIWPSALWDLVDGAAHMMGFSNPRVTPNTLTNLQNFTCGGDRKAAFLGNLQEETAVLAPSTGYDELDFESLTTVPQLYLETTLPIGTAAGLITNIKVTPFLSNKTAGLNVCSTISHACLAANIGGLWAGDARVTIVVGHSKQNARFRVTWMPWSTTVAPTASDKSSLPSYTFATGETSADGAAVHSWSFDIPYVSPSDYMKPKNWAYVDGANDSSLGTLRFENTSTVDGPDICGDMNIAVFISWHNFRISGWQTNESLIGPVLVAGQDVPESGGDGGLYDGPPPGAPICDGRNHPLHRKSMKVPLGRRQVHVADVAGTASSAGYPITSYRQLIGKLLPVLAVGEAADRSNAWYNHWLTEFIQDDVTDTGQLVGDLIGLLRSFFSYESGSIMVGNDPQEANTYVKNHSQINRRNGTVTNTPVIPLGVMPGLRDYESFPSAGVAGIVKLPRYQQGCMTPLTPGTNNGPTTFLDESTCPMIPWNLHNLATYNSGVVSNSVLVRAAGEDFSLMWRRPIPHLYTTNVFSV